MPQQVLCPTCGRKIQWSEDFPFRPFCSDRCRQIDLGAWASAERVIPGETCEPNEQTAPDPDDSGNR